MTDKQRDSLIARIDKYDATHTLHPVRDYFDTLMDKGSVEVGYRVCCGAKSDTAKVNDDWQKVIKTLRRHGYTITEQDVKHKNAYATNNGGFWNSTIYTIIGEPA